MRSRIALAGLFLLAFCATSARTLAAAAQQPGGAQPSDPITQGDLRAVDSSGKARIPCPLKHTDVRANISGSLARVTVTQQFENPLDEKIEAIYLFPLPQTAAVDRMTMRIGYRTIE